MAYFRRLIVALVLLFAAPSAFAACTGSQPNFYCDEQGEAYAKALTVVPKYPNSSPGPAEVVRNGVQKEWYTYHTYPNGDRIRSGGATWVIDLDCEARNSDPAQAPGSRLSLALDTGTKCVGGCILDITGDPLETVQGRVQGQPVVYYRFAQTYTGEMCLGQETTPGDNETDLDPTETPDGEMDCNPSLGVCVDENGNNNYCTFNPDGSASQCVPAIDYDNDGIDDDNDTSPADPTNGADDGSGDESDNSAGGGAVCLHKGGQAPSCAGDAIQCNILLQQYLARCASEKVQDGTISGGIACSSDAPLVCTNMSPGECFAKAQAKKTACAAESIANALSGEGGEEPLPEVDTALAWSDGQGGNAPGTGDGFQVDDSGWLGSRSCPTMPSVTVFGTSISFADHIDRVCNFFSITAALVLLFASFWAARIIGET